MGIINATRKAKLDALTSKREIREQIHNYVIGYYREMRCPIDRTNVVRKTALLTTRYLQERGV